MGRRHLAPLALAAAVAALATPAAEAKFKVSMTLEPARPTVRQLVRVTMRTEMVLPRKEVVSLIAVGPWRKPSGQGVLDAWFVRVGPRVYRTTLRFPYAGRWGIQVVTAPGATLTGRLVTVR